MTVTNGYCTVAELCEALSLPVDGGDSLATVELAIEAASRYIDGVAGDVFYPSADAARTFYPGCPWPWSWDMRTYPYPGSILNLPSIRAVDSVMTDLDGDGIFDETLDADTYRLTPESGAWSGFPYSGLFFPGRVGSWWFTYSVGSVAWPYAVKVTGDWGWTTPPAPVKQATIIEAVRLFKRRDAPYGIAGSADFGDVRLLPAADMDVTKLLGPYRRLQAVV